MAMPGETELHDPEQRRADLAERIRLLAERIEVRP